MAKIIGAPTLDDALAVLREQVAAHEERGEKTLVFCEDKLTLLSERAILARLGGTFLTEVTTFARYLSGPRVLSKQGSVMIVSSILQDCEGELRYFRTGAAQAAYETIAQLAASRVDAETLRESAAQTDGTLQGKLLDLALLLEKYGETLRETGLVDESGYLSLLPEKLSNGELGEVHLIFFGFPSFTKQAQEGVRAALLSAADVTGIFLAGRAELYTNEGARVFRRVCEEVGTAESSMVGCSLGEEALLLRDSLFSPERFALPAQEVNAIRRFTAADEAEEYTVVAALIKKHLTEGLRYRDFAVLVPDAESFPAVEKVFSAFRIPLFADKKRAFSEHPFCALTLALLSAVADGVLPDEADVIAANYYFGEGDTYRNYLLKFGGYRGAVWREIKEGEAVKEYDRAVLCACRDRMHAMLKLFSRKGKGRVYTEGVRNLALLVNAEERTESLQNKFTGAEREFLSLTRLVGVLDEIDAIAGERTFTAREFYKVLENGWKALEVSMIPQSSDAVFVGDITDCKFERVRVLFATGLTDELPRTSADSAVVSDGELEKLESLRVEIEPKIAQVNARARESLALNLCAFEDALYLSYPLKQRGKETERGEVLQYAEKVLSMPPMPELFPFDCCEEEPAALKMLALKNGFEAGREQDGKKYSALYAAFAERYGEEATERLLSGGKKERVSEAEQLYFSGAVSPTLLEGYFACPYAGFANRALRLREREERSVLDTDAGTFVHAVLERVAADFNELQTEEACRALAKAIGEELLKTPRFAALADTGAGAYTAAQLVHEGEEVSAAAYRQLALSAFRVEHTEGKVALPELSLAGTADRIDRSDDFVRIIDYKTGAIDDSATAYYTGRKLQLQLYLKAAASGFRAAGAFYFPAADSYTKEDEVKYRMSGFYCADDEVLSRMDSTLQEGEKSMLFEGKRDGKYTDKGMTESDFQAFLDYAVLVSQKAENEMKAGNISPAPYEGACSYCKLKSLCGFVGTPRKEESVKCAEVVKIVRRERGEE